MHDKQMTYESLLNELPSGFCPLIGAGISYPPPSNLPTAQSIINTIISYLPITDEDRCELLASTSPDWENGLGYFDCLRFEQVMEAFWWSIDDKGTLLQHMFPPTQPNRYHFQIAQLLASGHKILTTNFDCLIEAACDVQGIPYTLIVFEKDYEDYLKNPLLYPNPIFKIHGTVNKESEKIHSTEIAATMESVVTQRSICPSKWSVIEELLAHNALLVLGYSGFDDFDVLPAIRFAPGKQRLVWIQHSNSSHLKVWHASDNSHSEGFRVDNRLRWFFGRMFGSHLYMARVKRSRDDIFLATGSTEQILDCLVPNPRFSIENNFSTTRHTQHLDLLSQVIQRFLGNESPQVFLFVGRLLFCVGLYSRALVYLGIALDKAKNSSDPQSSGRIHAALAHIWTSREERYKAHLHMVEARNKFLMLEQLHSKDLDDFLEFSVLLGVDPFETQNPRFFKNLSKETLEYKQTRIKRKILLQEGVRHAKQADYSSALETAFPDSKNTFSSFDLEEQADLRFFFLRIDRVRNLHMARLGQRQDGAWDESEKIKYGFTLQDIYETYELLQRKAKWAQAYLYQAEEHMWSVSSDWAIEEATIAQMIFNKIGNKRGADRCEKLLKHIEAIKDGETGSVYYRRDDTHPYEIYSEKEILDIDELHYFCPRCMKLVPIRIQTCTKCGYILLEVDAPITKKDAEMSPDARLKVLYEIISKR